MPDFLPDDDRFAELMKKSSLRMPFSDFDENVMRRIEADLTAKESILKNINIAIFFSSWGQGAALHLFSSYQACFPISKMVPRMAST